jgi:hypothetical protein
MSIDERRAGGRGEGEKANNILEEMVWLKNMHKH